MATKKEKDKEILMKTKKPGLPVNISKPSIPQSSNAMGASGTVLNNVNVRPTRWQTAKHDAAYLTKNLGGALKKSIKSPNLGEKAKGVLGTAIMGATIPSNAGVSLFNVISGQARYNKNKRAGLERGDKDFKVRNSSTPLAETEFND
jgi:hypothetical protein